MPVTNRPVVAALALPVGAALVIGFLLLVTRPSALLHPSTMMRSPSTAGGEIPSPAACVGRTVRMPFTGVAINPPITEAAQSFSHATKTRVSIIEFYSGFPRPFPRYEAKQAVARGALPLIQ